MRWFRCDFDPTHPSDFGRWALEHGLHSKGSDFTSRARDYRSPGSSALRKLWAGNPSQNHKLASAWALVSCGRPVGVCAWERTYHNGVWQEDSLLLNGSFACLGRISLWMSPDMRGKGWMGDLVRDVVSKEVDKTRQQCRLGAAPFIRAVDAAEHIISRHAGVLVLPQFLPDMKKDAAFLAHMGQSCISNPRSILRRRA